MTEKTSLHTRMYPARGELAKVGQICVIESLRDDERHTGRAITEHLLDLFLARSVDVRVTLRVVTSATELLTSLEDLCADVERTRRFPILHIECHGLTDLSGVCLSDGSSASWEALKPALLAINLASRFNLFLIMGSCNGGYFGQIARLEETSAICAYLGPNSDVGHIDLLKALCAFYTELFNVFDATAAMNSLRAAVPGFPYFFTTAEGLFRLGAEGYIRDCANPRALRERARSLVEKLRLAGNPGVPSINQMMRTLKELERTHLENCIRTFFAMDAIAENRDRFPLTYSDLLSGAARRDGRLGRRPARSR